MRCQACEIREVKKDTIETLLVFACNNYKTTLPAIVIPTVEKFNIEYDQYDYPIEQRETHQITIHLRSSNVLIISAEIIKVHK